jgi:hypothetical protein
MEDRMSDDVVDSEIARYRAQLVAEAELAGGDLDEIEDHLRSLTQDLRERGMPAAAAVSEAARRLGEPRALAHEHARVRSPFGARLSRARAWSAAVPLAIMFGWVVALRLERDMVVWQPDLLLTGVLLVALLARLTWARPVLLGGLASNLVSCVLVAFSPFEPAIDIVPWIMLTVAASVFLAPWRRGELTRPALALTLLVWTFFGASAALSHQYAADDGSWIAIAPIAYVALAGAILASCGIVVRARWSAPAALASALALAAATIQLWELTWPHRFVWAMTVGQLVLGIAAALGAALIAWRTARSRYGTLGAVLR